MVDNNRYGVGILGVGHYIPNIKISNQDIEEKTKLSAQTIIEKTGIQTRYVVDDQESASGMSVQAARKAIEMAQILPEQVGQVICCTFAGDYVFPAMACKVQEEVGAKDAGSFDIMANCTGFQVGLGVLSDRMYCDPTVKYGIVTGTAVQSRYLSWDNPELAMYFGDGAGAAVLGQVPEGYGILANAVFTNGKVFEAVRLRGGGSSYPLRADNIEQGLQYYEMDGMEVWKQVIQNQPKVIRQVLAKIGKTIEDVDFFIFHQANLKLIEYMMARMKQPMSKTHTTVEKYGNTADASLAITLSEAVANGQIKHDQLIVISGVGAGFTFGATVIRWY
jgi:3-oxoacyl-[acyl-carrier-protein] synthase-3